MKNKMRNFVVLTLLISLAACKKNDVQPTQTIVVSGKLELLGKQNTPLEGVSVVLLKSNGPIDFDDWSNLDYDFFKNTNFNWPPDK